MLYLLYNNKRRIRIIYNFNVVKNQRYMIDITILKKTIRNRNEVYDEIRYVERLCDVRKKQNYMNVLKRKRRANVLKERKKRRINKMYVLKNT